MITLLDAVVPGVAYEIAVSDLVVFNAFRSIELGAGIQGYDANEKDKVTHVGGDRRAMYPEPANVGYPQLPVGFPSSIERAYRIDLQRNVT
jgi:hypothetical protein